MPLTVPTGIAAIASVVLAIAVIIAAWFARRALNVLSTQLAAQHERTAQLADVLQLHGRELQITIDERRRAQACKIFIELDRSQDRVSATVRNSSDQPVYDLYLIWQLGTVRMGKPDRVARLFPGDKSCFERGSEAADADAPADPTAISAFLTFRDSAGVRWTVREDGTLSDMASAAPHT
jgi:hypothetical protein